MEGRFSSQGAITASAMVRRPATAGKLAAENRQRPERTVRRVHGKITKEEVVDTNGSGHGALAGFLKGLQVDTLICGGIGAGAQNALVEAGIRLYGGVSGNADEAVKALTAGTLAYNPDVHCDHHSHEHGEGHSCGHGHGHGHGEGHECRHGDCGR